MASNLDLNVIISASFEKLKKGMADAVNVVKGSTKKMEEAAAGSKKALEQALGGENLRVKRRELTQTINEQRSILTSFKQDLIALENKLAQTSKGDLMRQKALKDAIAGLKVEIKDQESAVRQLSDTRAQANFDLEEGSRRAEQNTQAMEAMSRAINAASMATLLLAGDNKEVSKIMRGVQVTMALASAAVAVYNLAQRQNEIFTTASTVAQKAYAIAVGTSTGAMKAFRVVLASLGIGLVIAGITALLSKLVEIPDAVEETENRIAKSQRYADKALQQRIKIYDLEQEKSILQLKKKGATEEELKRKEISNFEDRIKFLKQVSNEEQYSADAREQLDDEAFMMEQELAVKRLELEVWLNKENLDNYEKYLEDKRKLEIKMQENLTKFLQDEEAKRLANLSARRKPREMTEADLMPAGEAAPITGVIGEGTALFDDVAESANNATDAVTNFATNFRNATKGLAIDIRKTVAYQEQWAISLGRLEDSFNQMLDSLKTEAIIGFAEMLGKTVAGEINTAQDFFQGFAQALTDFLAQFGKLMIAEGIAMEAADKAIKTGNGVAAIVAGAALVTAAAAMKAFQSKGIPAFADGGIVSGPTLGLMGEYPGARSNPEVIAPLDKLQSMINTGGGSGELVASTRFDGRDLWLAVNRYEKDKARG